MCGIAGAIAPTENVVPKLLKMLERQWNRGHTSHGLVIYDVDSVMHVSKGFRLPKDEDVANLRGECGVAHLRYSTRGSDEPDFLLRNAQPYTIGFFKYNGRYHPQRIDYETISKTRITSHRRLKGFITIAHNGDIFDTGERRDGLYECDIKYLAWKMAGAMSKRFNDRPTKENLVLSAKKVIPQLKGSFTYVGYVAGENGVPLMFAGRDPWGIKPGFVGRKERTWLVASENAAFEQVECRSDSYSEIKPGHIHTMDADGSFSEDKIKAGQLALCGFEDVYVADPDSTLMGRNISMVRWHLGNAHGTEDIRNGNVPEADIIVPVPDSGRSYAQGYHDATKIKVMEGLSKNRARIDRTFILQKQSQREEEVGEKLLIIRPILENRKVIVADDSLVRGTTMKKLIKRIREEGGAKEVHVRIGSPPIMYPCYLGIDMKSRGEFAAAQAAKNLGYDIYNGFQKYDDMYPSEEAIEGIIDAICELIDADSLGYLSMENFVQLAGPDRCLGCWNAALNPAELRDDILATIRKHPEGHRV